MSFKKSLAKSAVAFFFATFLTLVVLSYSLFQITDKDTMKPIAINVAEQQVTPEQLDQLHTYILQQCENEKTTELSYQNGKILIDCDKVRNSPKDQLIYIIYSDNLDKTYNMEYNCEFLECLRTQPTVIFSKKANDFFLNATYMSIVLTLVSGILLAFVSKDGGKFGIIRAFGWSFVFVGVSYFLILAAKNSVVPPEVAAAAGTALDTIFNIILFNLLAVLVAGIILLTVGYVPKLRSKEE